MSNRPGPLFPHATRYRSSGVAAADPFDDDETVQVDQPAEQDDAGEASPAEEPEPGPEPEPTAEDQSGDDEFEPESDDPTAEEAPLHDEDRSEAHTSELQSLMRNSYAVFCLKKKNTT